MNIEKFINCHEIAAELIANLEKENSEDLPLKYAWLVWKSHRATLEEKHAAWQGIIDTMPDYDIPKRKGNPYYSGSLHKLLKDCIALQKADIENLCKDEDNVVYKYAIRYTNDRESEDEDFYKTYADCLAEIKKEECAKYDDVCSIIIRKRQLYPKGEWTECVLKSDGKTIMDIDGSVRQGDEFDINQIFENMWFDFPVPFKRGDILKKWYSYTSQYDYFVFDQVICWGKTHPNLQTDRDIASLTPAYARPLEWYEENGDFSDMACIGYCVNEDNGELFLDTMHFCNYMDVEYCHEELKGYNKTLKALSNYLKGKINLELLMNTYYIVRNEIDLKKSKRMAMTYRDDWLEYAGLIESKEEEKL